MRMCSNEIERALLCNFEEDIIIDEFYSSVKNIWEGNWVTILKSDICTNLFSNEEDVKIYLESCSDRENVFACGLACFLTFIQSNFTGPPLSDSIVQFLNEKDLRLNLAVDEEEPNSNVTHPELLNISKWVFQYCQLNNKYINYWWFLRYVLIHQSLLEDCTKTLYTEAESRIKLLMDWNLKDVELKSRLEYEIAQLHLMFGKVHDAEIHLTCGNKLMGIDFEMAGELGKRTKYQEKDVAQLILKVRLADKERPLLKEFIVPNIVQLNDDVRLNEVNYNNKQELQQLSVLEQIALLITVQVMQRARPKDELLLEESEAFLSYILRQNNTWSIRTVALLLRCHIESNHKRTVERSLAQCESIMTELHKNEPSNIQRIQTMWNINVPPKWTTEAQLADLMLNLGLVKASLDIYLRLELWEEVIICYTVLQLRHKAAEVIQQQLAEKETVKLWCLLGDATDDVACYEKAWDLSNFKSARAQRHWGQFLFSRKEYSECIPHLNKSLELNSLQNTVWLRLAYAALTIEDWKMAASAYRRYTSLEPGTFEAWNNMAKAYIKLGEKNRAHFALQEALKYSFDNWKVWDNFMVVSADILRFDDVIRAYHQILNIKQKHLDTEVLFVLVKHLLLVETEPVNLLTKSRELFGRLTSLYPNETKLWQMYADLAPTPDVKVQRLYRSYRGLVQNDWSKDPVASDKVLDVCIRLGKVSLTADSSSLSSAKLTLRAAVSACQKQNWEQNAEKLKEVEQLLENILEMTRSQ